MLNESELAPLFEAAFARCRRLLFLFDRGFFEVATAFEVADDPRLFHLLFENSDKLFDGFTGPCEDSGHFSGSPKKSQ